jgi:hypothetical protein
MTVQIRYGAIFSSKADEHRFGADDLFGKLPEREITKR